MKKYFLITIIFITMLFTLSRATLAVCPVCTVAIIGGLGLSRWLGIDDLISGLWIGGLIMSSSYWLVSFLETKKKNFKYSVFLSILAFYAVVFIPMYAGKVIGHPYNSIFGIDKLLFGSLFGSLLFQLSIEIDTKLRKTNKGKVYVPYQKVIVPVSLLLIASIIFYFVI